MSQSSTSLTHIPWARPDFWGLEEPYVLDALRSSWISGGPYVDRLERELAHYTKARFALACANGTASIHLAYFALGLQPGDEIIVPGFGFQACANVALQMRLRPIFAEVDPDTWCVSARHIEPCLTERTRAIAVIHTYGNMCEMDGIIELARAKRIPVVEDAAEAFASKWSGRCAGTLGNIGTLSFQATKTISTGEGGLVLTDIDAYAQTMRLYRSHGMLGRRYWHEVPGDNFRLTNLQAALGCAQFARLETIIERRKAIHAQYARRMNGISGVSLQHFPPQVDPVLWAMAVRLDPEAYPQGRDGVMRQLSEAGIETRPGFFSPAEMPIYGPVKLDIALALSRNVLSVPTFASLSEENIERICARLKELRR